MKKELIKSIEEALEKLNIKLSFEIKMDHPADARFGDYTTNVAMVYAKQNGLNPIEVAQKYAKAIKSDLIEKIEIAGAGFINFYLKSKVLVDYAILNDDIAHHGKGKTMIIDYSAPNIAKPFGIGHLRSTNIGQALYNIYRTLGWNTIGDNHLGDWGTQFGKMIVAIKHWGDKPLEEMSIADLEKLYVKFHQEAENNEELVKEGRDWFARLEKGDKEARDIWQKCVDISLKEFNRVYDLLDVQIDETLGESFYEDKLKEIVKLFKDKDLVYESHGALLIKLTKNPEAMLLKSDGATNYLTRDLATIKYRIERWNPDLIIYEVGSEQKLYFSQLFESAVVVGWKPSVGYKHIGHGLIRWKDGKFSTRKGDTIHLSDVIETAMAKAKEIAPNNSEDEIKAVAIGAIKFNDLAQDPVKDIIFDWDKVMSMEGNSGPYLQYTYARCRSVISKSKVKSKNTKIKVPNQINEEEMSLLREFYKFEEKIVEAAERYNPAVIAEYLLVLARKYNEFYAKHRIVGEPQEMWRAWLTEVTSEIIKKGLDILGIKTLEKM